MAQWRRKRKRVQWSALEYAWNAYQEDNPMAIGGGAISAYACSPDPVIGIKADPTTRLRTECATVDDAMLRLAAGETVIVSGGDMAALWMRWAQQQAKAGPAA